MPTDAREAEETIRIAERMEDRALRLAAFVRQAMAGDGVIPLAAARQILRDATHAAELARTVVESAEETSIKELIAASVLTRHGPSPHLISRASERGIVIIPLEIHRRHRGRQVQVADGDDVPLDAA